MIILIYNQVMPGSVYISENLSFSCDSSNCSKDIVNVTYENIYFNKNLDLKVAKIYNKDNYKKIFDKEYSDDNAIFVSSTDYEKLYKSSDVYQISLFVDNARNIDKTINELTNYEVFS